MERPLLSVVVPVLNEREVLPAFVERLTDVLGSMRCSYEVLFVDDGSTDATWSFLQDLTLENPQVGLIRLSRNFGHQVAISAGMEHATGSAVVVMDADLQDPPEVLPELVAQWQSGFDIVYARRTEREEGSFKRWTAAMYYRVIRSVSPVPLPVDVGDFRLVSQRVVERLNAMPERARYVRGMVAWTGLSSTHVSYERPRRVAGETKFPLSRMVGFATDGLLSFTVVPLRIATGLGFTIALLSLGVVAWVVVRKVFIGTAIQGWTSLIAVTALLGSAQLVCLGIIGEYVGRIYEQVKGRPLYVVDDVQHPRGRTGLP